MKKSFRSIIDNNSIAVGTYVQYPAPFILEILALAGMDFAVIDAEHGPNGYAEMMTMLYAAESSGIATAVRAPGVDEYFVKKVLDMGADCIKFPDIDTPEQAKRAVNMCKYPPLGTRGGCPGVRSNGYGSNPKNCWQEANESVTVLLSIEGPDGLRNMEEIVAESGADGINIGAGDLSRTLNVPKDDSIILEARDRCYTLCAKYGKKCMVMASSGEEVAAYKQYPSVTMFYTKRPEKVLYQAYKKMTDSVKNND